MNDLHHKQCAVAVSEARMVVKNQFNFFTQHMFENLNVLGTW